jgi:hypothetical protein
MPNVFPLTTAKHKFHGKFLNFRFHALPPLCTICALLRHAQHGTVFVVTRLKNFLATSGENISVISNPQDSQLTTTVVIGVSPAVFGLA